MEEERYVQIGVTALRAPDGTFLESVPLYAEATEITDTTEARMYAEIGRYFREALNAESCGDGTSRRSRSRRS